jgi:hypothetical protein
MGKRVVKTLHIKKLLFYIFFFLKFYFYFKELKTSESIGRVANIEIFVFRFFSFDQTLRRAFFHFPERIFLRYYKRSLHNCHFLESHRFDLSYKIRKSKA